MDQTNHFFNLGYGWLCKHCSAEDAEHEQRTHQNQKVPHHSTLNLARWTDTTRQALVCPRCSIEETISKA